MSAVVFLLGFRRTVLLTQSNHFGVYSDPRIIRLSALRMTPGLVIEICLYYDHIIFLVGADDADTIFEWLIQIFKLFTIGLGRILPG